MITAEIENQIVRLNYRYVQCLDDDRLEEWPDLFTDDCRYVVHPRENFRIGLEGYWMYFDSKGMLRDRVLSLRHANTFNIHQDRHLLSNVMVVGEGDGAFLVRSNYLVVQTDVEGRSRVFSAGEYRDKVIFGVDGPKFREKLVIPDTFNVEGMLAVPL